MSEGELLTGDGVTEGIVRIGDTAWRPLRPFSPPQAYLAHLRDAGLLGCAASRSASTSRGREMLSFVPGDVPRNPPLPPEQGATTCSSPWPG